MNRTVPFNKTMCCGCRACEQLCPKKAINMKIDEEGFLYPSIDKKKCIKCGICLKNCRFYNREIKQTENEAVVARHIDDSVRQISRSGAVFVALSNVILNKGGVVYGVRLDNSFRAIHDRAINKKERDKFCGSKYVQSDTENVFSMVLEDLINGKPVLFSGTACQVDGLYSYLSYKSDKCFDNILATCDIVCHGVVSPKIWYDNLKSMKRRNIGELISVNFRDKKFGWDSHIETYKYTSSEAVSKTYTSIFYEHVALRPACYNCPYAKIDRISDITLADAWGIKKYMPDWDDNKGTSLVILNNDKGKNIFYNTTELQYKKIDISNILQPNLIRPTQKPKYRDKFWKDYNKKGFDYVGKKCLKKQRFISNKNKLKSFVVKILRIMRVRCEQV